MRLVPLLFLFMTFLSCQEEKPKVEPQKEWQEEHPFTGTYQLNIANMKNCTSGELVIVGEPEDYFGKITLHAKRERVYEIGLQHESNDSLHFTLPGGGGFLHLKRNESDWTGKFKYFGIKADITAKRTGAPSTQLQQMVDLKPVGQGIISTDKEESFPSYDNINQILYFSRDNKLFSSNYSGIEWEKPIQLEISRRHNDSAPYLFNDGESMLFSSNRQIENPELNKKNIWQMNKKDGTWKRTILRLPDPVNIDTIGDYHAAIAQNGNVYFVSYNRPGGFGRSDIYVGVSDNRGLYEVSNLGSTINTEKSEADVFIDPEERYLLFASTGRADSYGADDIYISYKETNGWSKPVNIGTKVNSFAYEYGAWVDGKNKYLYFNSYRRGSSDIYRIKLEELEVFKDMH